MKIIGKTKIGEGYSASDGYVAIVSVDELRRVADKAGYRDDHGLDKLTIGEDYPIAEGYNFRAEILAATRAMTDAHDKFLRSSNTMHQFVSLINAKVESERQP